MHVNHHTLSDVRTTQGEAFDAVLTDSVAALMAVGAVTLERVAQDGMRILAVAGVVSCRRGETLERRLEEARAQVAALKRQAEDDPGGTPGATRPRAPGAH